MYWRYLYHTLIIIFVWLVQASFISVLPSPFNHLNLTLVIILILLLFDDLNLLYFWTITAAFLLSLSSRLPLGVLLPSWLMVVIICYLILKQFLTNKSLYSFLLLTLGATLFLELFVLLGSYIVKIFTGWTTYSSLGNAYFLDLFNSMLLNAATMVILFYFLNTINAKLKPFLMYKRRS